MGDLVSDSIEMNVALDWGSVQINTEVEEHYFYTNKAATISITMKVEGVLNDRE